MIRAAGERVEVAAAMTYACASELFRRGKELIGGHGAHFDLAAVSDVDSSALAVIFGWMREARRLGKRLTIVNPPSDLLTLADVYGVAELLPLASKQPG